MSSHSNIEDSYEMDNINSDANHYRQSVQRSSSMEYLDIEHQQYQYNSYPPSDISNGRRWDEFLNYRQEDILNRQRYATSMHRNVTHKIGRTASRGLETRRGWMNYAENERNVQLRVEEHAGQIVGRMEKDESLMEDTPVSEELRKTALRDMPQSLTIKRCVKNKLKKSVTLKAKHKPISLFKRCKYNVSILVSKFKKELKNLTYAFELWYSTLKSIEGHFGSSVASYFKFLKWLFLLNLFIMAPAMVFIIIPQIFYSVHHPSEVGSGFSAMDIVTGGGYFTNTILFFGHYTKQTLYITERLPYDIPLAYFFTMICLYIIMFCIFSVSMAKSYRTSFIETKGGLKNIFAHKIFCGWDYQIATEEAGQLKCASIYQELKDILVALMQNKRKQSCLEKFWTRVMQLISNLVVFISLAGVGYLIWFLLDRYKVELKSQSSVIPAVFINLVLIILPIIFNYIIKYEDYKSPKTILVITLTRIFLLQAIVIGALLGFWLTGMEDCWETHLGQEIYRLIIFDFLFAVIIETLVDIGRVIIHKYIWKGVDLPEFDIARNVLHIIYNQALLWIGFYFSPLLPVVVIIKLWLTWYIRSLTVLYLCKPTSKVWPAANAHTLFYILSFISLLLIMAVYGYILIEVESSGCGPFTGHVSREIIDKLLMLEDGTGFWRLVKFVTKPGVIALVLIGLGVMVYYQREKSQAQKGMVALLREMLIWEAKDKEFLLQHISKMTGGQWQYKIQEGRAETWDPLTMLPYTHNQSDEDTSDDLSSSGDIYLNPKKYR